MFKYSHMFSMKKTDWHPQSLKLEMPGHDRNADEREEYRRSLCREGDELRRKLEGKRILEAR